MIYSPVAELVEAPENIIIKAAENLPVAFFVYIPIN